MEQKLATWLEDSELMTYATFYSLFISNNSDTTSYYYQISQHFNKFESDTIKL